ncbi:MAG TPA: type II secretion system F family protein [Candidatus Melainabacteria bacterium]|nr:type II secretion system F family protein [Candidatus Melainabacteria bacterium]
MNELETSLAAAFAITLVAGTLMAKHLRNRRQRLQLARRLAPFVEKENELNIVSVNFVPQSEQAGPTAVDKAHRAMSLAIEQGGAKQSVRFFLTIMAFLFLVPLAIASTLGLNVTIAAVIGCILASLPIVYLKVKRAQIRTKFISQLPEAIDLMVSVLRTGHSVPQAVKTVAEELPAPVGGEFAQVLQRMNLGQTFSQSLLYTCEKFTSFELDLIRRAATIQAETGGSLAELLEKTNSTLRQRLKLVRQVGVLTAQSKLTATVVSLLPFAMAALLQYLSPGYLNPLIQSQLGQMLLCGAMILMLIGALIMRKMATVKV